MTEQHVKLADYYSFHPLLNTRARIRLSISRRKKDPHGCYAPVGDLSCGKTATTWKELDVSNQCFPGDFIENCLAFPHSVEEALAKFNVSKPPLRNTVIIRYRTPRTSDANDYGVFLVLKDGEQIYLEEIYTLTIKGLTEDQVIVDQEKPKNLVHHYRLASQRLGDMYIYNHEIRFCKLSDKTREYLIFPVLSYSLKELLPLPQL